MLTEQQLKERLKFVTGSDSGVICGVNKKPSGEFYKTRLQLWQEKTGRVVAEDIGHLNHIKFGNFFEQGVADWFCAETGKIAHSHPVMLVHKSHSWMAGNIDFKVVGENAILECKTAYKDDEKWGESATDDIPLHYLTQVAHYCAVGGFDRAYIAVVFAMTRDMRWYVYERNPEFEAKLIAREKDFWENNVLADVPPEPVNTKDIMAIYKEAKATPVMADDNIYSAIIELREVKREIDLLEDRETALKEMIQLHMLDADTLVDENGIRLATWKYTKPIAANDLKKLETKFPDVYAACRTTGKAQRRFVMDKVK